MILSEYLIDDNGKKSLSKLLKLWAFTPATCVLLWVHTTEAMSIYGGLFVLDTAFSKGMDTVKAVKNKQTDGNLDVANSNNKSSKK